MLTDLSTDTFFKFTEGKAHVVGKQTVIPGGVVDVYLPTIMGHVVETKDKVNKDKYVGNQSNLYKVRSDYNKAMSAIYTLQWSFSNSELIYPGMPCSFIYEDNERDIVELKGMILNVYEVYEANTNTTNSLLTIAVQKPINDPSNDVYNKD